MLIEVDDSEQQELFYDILQDMIEERNLCGYFTLVDDGKAVEDLPDYMEYEINKLIPEITKYEASFINPKAEKKHGKRNDNL